MQGVEGSLLRISPRPGVILPSKENDGNDDVRIIGNEFVIEICKPQEGVYSFDRERRVPFLDGREFCRIHVNKTLTNDHSMVFHGGDIKGTL